MTDPINALAAKIRKLPGVTEVIVDRVYSVAIETRGLTEETERQIYALEAEYHQNYHARSAQFSIRPEDES